MLMNKNLHDAEKFHHNTVDFQQQQNGQHLWNVNHNHNRLSIMTYVNQN